LIEIPQQLHPHQPLSNQSFWEPVLGRNKNFRTVILVLRREKLAGFDPQVSNKIVEFKDSGRGCWS
jgi:hypothetical protein